MHIFCIHEIRLQEGKTTCNTLQTNRGRQSFSHTKRLQCGRRRSALAACWSEWWRNVTQTTPAPTQEHVVFAEAFLHPPLHPLSTSSLIAPAMLLLPPLNRSPGQKGREARRLLVECDTAEKCAIDTTEQLGWLKGFSSSSCLNNSEDLSSKSPIKLSLRLL